MTHRLHLIALALVLSGALAAMAAPPAPVANSAWATGEQLDYTVKYGFLTAGTGAFRAADGDTRQGRPTYKFNFSITSSPSFFFKLNDLATSISDRQSLYTLRYEKREQHGKENKIDVTVFNHDKGSAQRTENGKAHDPITAAKYPIDVLGLIYYVRTRPLTPGQMFKVAAHDGRRDYTVEVSVKKKETITVPAGKFTCLVVEPKLRMMDGQYSKKGQMQLWLTDDARRIPVRVTMGVAFGSITCNLTKMTGVQGL